MICFDAADLYLHKTIESLGGAEGQDGLAFVVANPNKDTDRYQSALWFLRPSGYDCPRRLTSLSFDAKSPSLAPDGRSLAFISTRDPEQGPQLHTIPVDGGEATVLTRLSSSPERIQMWSPDGNALLLTVKSAWAEDELDDVKAGKSRPLVAGFLPYKADGGGERVGHRTQLHRIDAKSGRSTTLVSGDFDVQEAQWSPDGTRLLFVRNRTSQQRHIVDLWLADADGGNAERIDEDLASINGARWSPDGKFLAFAGSRVEGDSLSNLWLYEVATKQLTRPAGDGLQLEGQWLVWHPDGDRIATVMARRGLFEIAIVSIPDGNVKRVHLGLRHVQALCKIKDRLVFVLSSIRKADEIHSIGWDGADLRCHSAFNANWFNERIRPRAIKRKFEVPDGGGGTERIEAWLLLPPHREGPFPLLVEMHGGPQSVMLTAFADHVYWYQLVSLGWAIVAPNAVGSGSYSPDFARRLVGRWGELDLPQHLAIIDQLQREGIADLRVACTGKSYGGFLASWAIGHSSRFTSAVISAPVTDIESHAGTSDTGYYVTPYAMGAEPTDDGDRYQRLSPIQYCSKAHAATLILQGQDDQRCPVGQAEEMFANLVRCGTAPCKLVVYPGGSHAMAATGKPSHRVNYHRRLAEWVQHWTAEEARANEHTPADGADKSLPSAEVPAPDHAEQGDPR